MGESGKAQKPSAVGHNKTHQNPGDRGNQEGDQGPFPALGFLSYGQAGGAAGPVHQRKKHDTHGCEPGPAIGYQQLMQLA